MRGPGTWGAGAGVTALLCAAELGREGAADLAEGPKPGWGRQGLMKIC